MACVSGTDAVGPPYARVPSGLLAIVEGEVSGSREPVAVLGYNPGVSGPRSFTEQALRRGSTMNTADREALVAIPLIVVMGVAVGWSGSQGGATIGAWPVFALCGLVSFGLNWAVFVHAYLQQTEKFFDLTGSITYVTLTGGALVLTGDSNARALLLAAMVVVWAVRLGSFLFRRVTREGSDGRFDALKPSFPRFFMTWTLQALWVLLTLACALAAITTSEPVPLGGFAFVGSLVWVVGFAIEVIADRQKGRFRAEPGNRDRFIEQGIWS